LLTNHLSEGKPSLGWHAFFEHQLKSIAADGNMTLARVVEAQREAFLVDDGRSERWCTLSGRLRHELLRPIDLPAVGDFVLVRATPGADTGQITRTLARRGAFMRKAPETGALQIVAANIDVAFVVSALNTDHNLRRIERYLAMVWESGAMPVVLLTKSDLCADLERSIARVEAIAPGVTVLAASAVNQTGVEDVRHRIRPGMTAVLLGSSGSGKSTLVNALLGRNAQAVQQVSAHMDKGRHTTTARKLLHVPGAGMIIDTPGMKELQLTEADAGVSQTFNDIEQLAAACRFSDCNHQSEPGCAIRVALEEGRLDRDRYKSYQKLQRESAYEARREDTNLARLEKERWKKIHTANKRRPPKWMR